MIKNLLDISNCYVLTGSIDSEFGQTCFDESMLEYTSNIAEAFLDISYDQYITQTLDINQKSILYQILVVNLLAYTCKANFKKFSEIVVSKNL